MGTWDSYVSSIKNAWVSIQVRLVKTAVLNYLPWLAPMAGVLEFILQKIFGWSANQEENAIFFQYTDFRSDKQGQDFVTAAEAYHSASPEEKHLYEKEYLLKFYALGSFKS